ncbi:MAG: mismatch-specific DNA-glycosylase [Gemmatimonadales bacterium]
MLPDLLAPGLRLVVCGSAVGSASATAQAYYAGRGNRFWETLAVVELTPQRLSPSDYAKLLSFGIGLTDLLKTQAGNDDEVTFGAPDRDRLTASMERWQPGLLCFNGKRAAAEYLDAKSVKIGLQQRRIGQTRLFVAPSTSGAARRSWALQPWQEVARLVGSKWSG